jgi:O-antigen/teichoic acid export membrane protein
VNAFRWLAVALGMVCVTTVVTASILAAGKEKLLLTIGIAALLANIALNVVLLRHHDFTAAGFVTAVTELLFLLGAVIVFDAVTGCSVVALSWLPYLLPSLVLGAVFYFVRGGAAFRVAVGIGLGALAVASILLSPQARRFRKETAAHSLLLSAENVASEVSG